MLLRGRFVKVTGALLAGIILGGCGTLGLGEDEGPEYRQSGSAPALEVPPDLTRPRQSDTYRVEGEGETSATYSGYQAQAPQREAAGRQAVLPESPIAKVKREDDKRWLVVEAKPEALWPKVKAFWKEQGLELEKTEPEVGVMETSWAMNRAEVPGGGLSNIIGRALGKVYAADTRDKFRVRLERGQHAGETELFLTHYGMKEVAHGSDADVIETTWEMRQPDPELEAIMLRRLMVFLGAEEAEAKRRVADAEPSAPKAHLREDEQGLPYLDLDTPYQRAWRVVGVALDRVGFTVQDRNRARGVYFVRYHPPEADEEEGGFLSNLAFWRDEGPESTDQYEVNVTRAGEERTRVAVRDAQGSPTGSDTARRILRLLHQELK